MPRHYIRVADRKPKEPIAPEGAAVILPDAAVLLYKDRAGARLGGGHKEPSTYMGFVSEQARASVPVEAE